MTTRVPAVCLALVLTLAACAEPLRTHSGPRAIEPPVPSRNTAARADAEDRARFACAVRVQDAQQFDPATASMNGSVVGTLGGAGVGASLGALFGLISNTPGASAAIGAVVGGGFGAMIGGLFKLEADRAAYERGLAACLAACAAGDDVAPVPPAPPGLVEYRLRVLNIRTEAFTSFLSTAELAEHASGPGLMRLADAADAGDLPRGIVLSGRRVAPVSADVARAFGATTVAARVKLASGRDQWDEARWYGAPGARTVFLVTAGPRRPEEVQRLALSDVSALAQFRPLTPGLFGARPQATIAVSRTYLERTIEQQTASAWLERALDPSRALASVVAVSDDKVFPDRVYVIVNHATSAATYETVLAWGRRGEERELRRDP